MINLTFKKKNHNQAIITQLPSSSLKKNDVKKLRGLEKKVSIMELVRIILVSFIFLLSCFSMLLLGVPVNALGMPLYSILLISHSLLFLGLSIVHYQFLPQLIDESTNLSYKIKQEIPDVSPYHPTKSELSWCYSRILISILINAGIWKFLSYMDFEIDVQDENGSDVGIIVCFFLGMLLFVVSFLVLSFLGPLYSEPKVKKPKTKQRKEDADKRINQSIKELLLAEDETKAVKYEEITMLRNEVLENSKINKKTDKLLKELQERDKEKDQIILELSQDVKRLKGERNMK
ncbi:hypothetical protein MOSE0_D00210 [Monosporozyma servazzii]